MTMTKKEIRGLNKLCSQFAEEAFHADITIEMGDHEPNDAMRELMARVEAAPARCAELRDLILANITAEK